MRPVLLVAVALVSLTGVAAQCTTNQPTPPPVTTPTPEPTTTPAPAPTPAPSAQDPSTCGDVCAQAQTKCRKNKPKPVEHCISKCKDSTAISAPNLACLAVVFTCDEDCQ